MKIIDLSEEIYDGQRSHFNVTVRDFLTHAHTAPRLAKPAEGYGTKLLMMPDHVSTHVDAPSHYWPDRNNIDEVPIERFCGEAIVIDFSQDPTGGGVIDVEMFEEALGESGLELRADDIVLFHVTRDGETVYEGISADLADHFVNRGAKMVGIDRGTVDAGFHKHKPAHVILLQNDVPIIEGLRHLDRVVNQRIMFFGLPLKIRGGTGSPIRAVGVLDWR